MTGCTTAAAPATEHERRVLAALGATYPGWRYLLVPAGSGLPRWWACRYTPPTPAQHAAGVRMWIGRCTWEGLAAVLAIQADLCSRL